MAPARDAIARYVAERCGSLLSGQQLQRLHAALNQKLNGRAADGYLEFLKTPEGAADLAALMASTAVHKTDLFRDEVQLRAFRDEILRPLAREGRPLRLWSAGCATGEEVATLLILLAEENAHLSSTVLATDLSEAALDQARQLTFPAEVVKRVPSALLAKYFTVERGMYSLRKDLAAKARFSVHNLMDLPYPGGGFDAVFCRNVLIYFTEAAFDRVVERLVESLSPSGVLCLSAAEPVLRPGEKIRTIRCDSAFFYGRATPGWQNQAPASGKGRFRSVTSDEMPAVSFANAARAPMPAMSPKLPDLPPSSAPAPNVVAPPPVAAPTAVEEAAKNFQAVLELAAVGLDDKKTEVELRRCLYLDPQLCQARYLLGMILEQRGEKADAASEYRRALNSLMDGKARVTPFFLNNERLKTACSLALKRVGHG